MLHDENAYGIIIFLNSAMKTLSERLNKE